jgi:hypothetical protein
MSTDTLSKYPAGAMVRVREICGDRRTGRPGLLPIVPRTWFKWAAEGKVPPGLAIGRTRAWKIEDVLAVSGQTAASTEAA